MLPLTVALRHRAAGRGWQFEEPLSAVPVPVELGEPWDGVPGLGREEEVAGSVAGLCALSLTDSHSEAPLVLVHSGVRGWESLSRLQAGWTRYFRGKGPFCRGEMGRDVVPGTLRHWGWPPALQPALEIQGEKHEQRPPQPPKTHQEQTPLQGKACGVYPWKCPRF